jgi:hypothetical protein
VSRRTEPINPFYVLLVVVGVAFTLTACAYGLMMFNATQPVGRIDLGAPDGLLGWLNAHGGALLTGELILLAVATLGAIVLDDRRIKRRERDKIS